MLRDELPKRLSVVTQQQWGIRSENSLLVNLLQDQPAVVPAPNTVRVSHYHCFSLVEGLRAEWILLGEASKFVEEVV